MLIPMFHVERLPSSEHRTEGKGGTWEKASHKSSFYMTRGSHRPGPPHPPSPLHSCLRLRIGHTHVAPGLWDLCFASSMQPLVGTLAKTCVFLFAILQSNMHMNQSTGRIRYSLAG